MKKFKEVQKPILELTAIVCDCCKKEYTDVMELQEFLHYENDYVWDDVDDTQQDKVPDHTDEEFLSTISSFKDDIPE